MKRPRAPPPPPPEPEKYYEPDQDLDERNGPPKSNVPPGFLSPSVAEYLELGKSIPGELIIHHESPRIVFVITNYLALVNKQTMLFSSIE